MNQVYTNYDSDSNLTSISIDGEGADYADHITLEGGNYSIVSYLIEDDQDVEIKLIDPSKDISSDNLYYWLGDQSASLQILDLAGGEIRIDRDFGFDVDNIENEFTTSYDSELDQTTISINTETYNRDDIITVAGEHDFRIKNLPNSSTGNNLDIVSFTGVLDPSDLPWNRWDWFPQYTDAMLSENPTDPFVPYMGLHMLIS